MKMKKSIWIFAIAIALIAMAGPAKAAVITFSLDSFVTGTLPGSGSPYGTVQLVDNGNNVDFTVSLNTSQNVFVVSLNFLGSLGNVADWSIVAGNIGPYTLAASSNNAGYNGYFDIRVEDSSTLVNPLTFRLTKSSTDLDASMFNTKDETNTYYAIVRTSGVEVASSYYGATTSAVPEPSTLLLLGSGLLGLVGYGRRMSKK